MTAELQSRKKIRLPHPRHVLMALLFLAPLPFSVKFISYSHPKEFVVVTLVTAGALLLRRRGDKVPRAVLPLMWLWLWLWLMAMFTLQLSAYMLAPVIFFLFTYFARLGTLRHWRLAADAAFVAGALVVALLALGQYAGWLHFLFPSSPHYDQRMYSVFGNQDLLGGYMAAAICVVLARAEFARGAAKLACLVLALLPLVATLVLSGCRSAWAATVIGIVVAIMVAPRSRANMAKLAVPIALITLGVGVLTWDSTGARISSFLSRGDMGSNVRLWIWDGTLRMIADHPVFGVGFGNYARDIPTYMGDALHAPGGETYPSNDLRTDHAHSEPLNLIAQGGLIVAIPTAIALLLMLRHATGRAAWAPLAAMTAFAMVNGAWHSAPHAIASLWWLFCVVKSPIKKSRRRVRRDDWLLLPLLAGIHLYFVLIPSYRLAAAEDLALEGRNPVEAYERSTKDLLFRADAWLGLAAWHVEQQQWLAAYDAAAQAVEKGADFPTVHWMLGLSAAKLGLDDEARRHLRDCLHRNPRNKPAYDLLWQLTPEAERGDLEGCSVRFAISPGGLEATDAPASHTPPTPLK